MKNKYIFSNSIPGDIIFSIIFTANNYKLSKNGEKDVKIIGQNLKYLHKKEK